MASTLAEARRMFDQLQPRPEVRADLPRDGRRVVPVLPETRLAELWKIVDTNETVTIAMIVPDGIEWSLYRLRDEEGDPTALHTARHRSMTMAELAALPPDRIGQPPELRPEG